MFDCMYTLFRQAVEGWEGSRMRTTILQASARSHFLRRGLTTMRNWGNRARTLQSCRKFLQIPECLTIFQCICRCIRHSFLLHNTMSDTRSVVYRCRPTTAGCSDSLGLLQLEHASCTSPCHTWTWDRPPQTASIPSWYRMRCRGMHS